MLKVISRFWRAIGAASLLLAIFWLPKDIADSAEAAEPWRRALTVVDQNAALWLFSVGVLSWLIWTELRPLVSQWRAPKRDFDVEGRIYTESRIVKDVKEVDTNIYQNRFYLIVKNARKDLRTIRNVSASIFCMDAPRELGFRDRNGPFDLRAGEYCFILFGCSYNVEMAGLVRPPHVTLPDNEIEAFRHNAENNQRYGTLHIVEKDGTHRMGLGQWEDRTVPFHVVVSGDDCKPLHLEFDYDLVGLSIQKPGVWVTAIDGRAVPSSHAPTSTEEPAEVAEAV